MNYAEISAMFKEVLRLKGSPVAVKLIKQGESIPANVPESDIHMRYCNAICEARNGKSLVLPAKKDSCGAGASALGQMETPPKIKSGELHYNIGGFASPEAAKKMIDQRPELIAGEATATVVTPLEVTPVDPDVVLVIGPPESIDWILVASVFSTGGRISLNTASFNAICVDSTIIPYKTGKVNLSLGCWGCRKNNPDFAETEMIIGIPFKELDGIANALKQMSQKMIPDSRKKVDYRQIAK